jgi:long-chain acyl-CoA synthetase
MTTKHWIKTYGDLIPAEIDPKAFSSVVQMMEQAMVRFADRVAFHSFSNAITYAETDRLSRAFAAYLQHDLGVKKADRIAVMMPNLLAFPIAMLGIIRAGAIQVNVNPLYTPRELEHQLNNAGAEVIVIFNGSTPTLASVIERTKVRKIISVAVGDGGVNAIDSPPVDAALPNVVRFSDALLMGASVSFTPADLESDDLIFLQYTGGTTGLSKGAALSHGNMVANTEQFKAFMPAALRPGQEVVVTALPLYHIFALMVNFITYFSVGATNWLIANPRDADQMIDTMKKSHLTIFVGVNTLYAGLVSHPRIKEVDFSNLRLSAGGGAAVIPATSAKWKEITGNFIREGYGLSETSPVLSFNPATVNEFSGTTGLPMPSTDIKLIDIEGHEVAVGQSGEICAKGPQVMRGYWNQAEANKAAFTPDGYFKTGDVGVFDEKGYLKIVDRIKDMIIVSGFNVYPNEIEAVVSAIPGVLECACIGVSDEKTGEAVSLFVVKDKGTVLTRDDIVAHCRKELTGYKIPKFVTFVDGLPKSTVGKILRRGLRETT